jgi:cytochrome c oxidase cbb3-type subunit 3
MRAPAAIAVVLAVLCMACEREARRFQPPEMGPSGSPVRLTAFGAGGPVPRGRERSPYQENAYGIAEGKRLYSAFNCEGCHAAGGGGIGPALMDDKWIYGYAPDQIFATIAQGRPNGMPSFAGKVTGDQIWQLVAYIESLGANTPRDASPSRSDDMGVIEPELRLDRMDRRQTGHR